MKNVGNGSRKRSQGVQKIFRAPTYRAHCAVISAIAQLSCFTCCYHSMVNKDYQLRPFVRFRSLTTVAAKTLVQVFISCRLDYCNSLLYGVTDNVIGQAIMFCEVLKSDNISTVNINNSQKSWREHKPPTVRRLEFLSYFIPKLLLIAQYLSDCHMVNIGLSQTTAVL